MMKSKHLGDTRNNVHKDSKAALSDSFSRWVFYPGDTAWVKVKGHSWWPAQVIDNNRMSTRERPKKKAKDEVLVRLYGSYNYLYAENIKCSTEFENILKQNNSNIRVTLQNFFEKDHFRIKSGCKSKKKLSTSEETKDSRPKHNRIKRNRKKDCSVSAGASLAKTDEMPMDQMKGAKKGKVNSAKDKKPKQDVANDLSSKQHGVAQQQLTEKVGDGKQHGAKRQKLTKTGDEKHAAKRQKLIGKAGNEKHGAEGKKLTEKDGDEKHGSKRKKLTEKDGDKKRGVKRKMSTEKEGDGKRRTKKQKSTEKEGNEKQGAKKHKLAERKKDEKRGAKKQKTEKAGDEKQDRTKKQKLTRKAAGDVNQHGAKDQRVSQMAGDEKHGAKKGKLTEKAGNEISKLRRHNQNGMRKLKQQDVTENEKAISNHSAKKTAFGKEPDASARRMRVMQSLGLIAPLGSPFFKSGFLNSTPSQCLHISA